MELFRQSSNSMGHVTVGTDLIMPQLLHRSQHFGLCPWRSDPIFIDMNLRHMNCGSCVFIIKHTGDNKSIYVYIYIF